MEQLLSAGKVIVEHGPALLSAVLMLGSAGLAVSLLLPGDHPDKELQWCVNKLQWLVNMVKSLSVKGVILGKDLEDKK